MKKMNKYLILLALPLSISFLGVAPTETPQKVGNFDILDSSNCTITNAKFTSSNGSFTLKNNTDIKDNFSLQFNLQTNENQNANFGVIPYGQYSDNKLTGDVFRPYFNNGSWQMIHGTLTNGAFAMISTTPMDFGSNFLGNYEMAIDKGMMALRMDGWCIGVFDLVYDTGDTYFYGNNVSIQIDTPTISVLEQNFVNYAYREQWGGFNYHSYIKCLNKDATHSFKMNFPSTINKSLITKLYLARGTCQRNYGQKANIKINGVSYSDWENSTQTNTVNGGVDTYTEELYEIPLSVIEETNELQFEIKNIDGEYVIANYKLLYETTEGLYFADKIILNSLISENSHSFQVSTLGWNGAKYHFIDLTMKENGLNKMFIGEKVGEKVKELFSFKQWKASPINIEFTNKQAKEMDFFAYVKYSDAFSFRNELWFNSTKVSDSSIYLLENKARNVTYTLDFYIEGLDVSGPGTKKVSPANTLVVTPYESSEEEGEIYNVESDAYTFEKNGFIKVFNSKASRSFEVGSSIQGSELTTKVSGSSVSIFGYKGSAGGKFKVFVDNVEKGEFNTQQTNDQYKASLAYLSELGEGTHTLKIQTIEDKWVAIDYIQFEVPKDTYYQYANLAKIGDIVTSVPNPKGGGNKDLNVIRDEDIAPVGANGLGPSQYDSFDGSGVTENVFWMGYQWNQPMKVSKLCYQAGCKWQTGGWFKNGSLHLEALIDGTWTNVELLEDIGYPNSNSYDAFTPNQIYIFKFNQISCSGIRIIGDAGGSEHFVSVSEIEVYQNLDTVSYCEGRTYRNSIVL